MRFTVLAFGSKGNSTVVSRGRTRIFQGPENSGLPAESQEYE
jgi:hypothetical protein